MSSRSAGQWATEPLAEVIDFQEGPGIMAADFHDSGVPLIRLAGLTSESLLDGCNFLDPAKVAAKWSHFRLQTGDTLLSTSASLGRIARVRPEAAGAIAYTGLIRMRPRNERIISDYVPILLQDPHFQRQVEAMGAGSVMRHFGPTHLRQMSVAVPPVEEQEAIASVLGALDRRIESNWRLARNAQEVAEALVLEWLNSYSGPTAPVGELVDVKLGGTPSRKNAAYWTDGTVSWISSGKANEFRILEASEMITEEAVTKCSTKLLPAGTTVVAITGATCGKVSRVEIDTCANQSIVGLVGNDRAPDEVLYFWLRASIGALMTRQTGAAQQHVNKGDVESLPFPDVKPEELSALRGVVRPLMGLVAVALRESTALRSARTALLPKLAAGDIRVDRNADIAEEFAA